MASAALNTINELLSKLTEAEQLSVICDLVQGGPAAGLRSDAFIDALYPVDRALSDAWGNLECATGERWAA